MRLGQPDGSRKPGYLRVIPGGRHGSDGHHYERYLFPRFDLLEEFEA